MVLAAVIVATTIPNLTRPVRIVDAEYFKDGGTLGAILVGARKDTLRGGFDGKERPNEDSYPRHCYLGGVYVSDPRARPLPLWGEEERAFVALLDEGLRAKFSAAERNRLLTANSAVYLDKTPDEITNRQLVRTVTRRRQALEAIDHGGIEGEWATSSWFESKAPFRIEKIERHDGEFEIVVGNHTIFLPADSARALREPSREGGRFHLTMPIGTTEDRYNMTLVSAALRDDRRPFKERSAIVSLLRARTKKILADDARR